MSKPKKSAAPIVTIPAPRTRAEADALHGRLARSKTDLKDLETVIETELAAINTKYQDRLALLTAEVKAAEAALKSWIIATPAEFADQATVKTLWGTLHRKLGNWEVRLVPDGITEETVIAKLKARSTAHVRVVEQINREQIIIDRNELTDAQWAKLGIAIVQPVSASVRLNEIKITAATQAA